MSQSSISDLRYRALADPTRRWLLRALDDSDGPMGLEDLSNGCGLHINTVRGHLSILEEAGLVERSAERRQGPGRPRILFTASPRDARSPAAEGYRLLAGILSEWLVESAVDTADEAVRAGERWGRRLVDDTQGVLPAQRVVEQVTTTFAEMGFEPERHGSGIRLRDCPFRALARERGDVVCSVHEGLLRGMLQAMGGEVELDSLDPFVEPSLCIARLSGG